MTIEDQIGDEKLQYDINRAAAKMSALSSGKIDNCEYLTGEEVLSSNQQQIIERAKSTFSPLGKAFKKQTKTIEDQREKHINVLKSLESSDKQLLSIKDFILKERLNPQNVDEIEKIEEEERKADRSKMIYEGSNKNYDFRRFKTIRVFGNEISNNIINRSMANDEQDQLLRYILMNLKVKQDHRILRQKK